MDINGILKKFEISSKDYAVYMKTGILPLDLAFNGKGIPCGSLGQVYSPAGSGKSTMLIDLCKKLADSGIECWYCSVENSYKLIEDFGLTDPQYASLFHNLNICTYNELQEISEAFLSSKARLMIIDSISAVVSSKMIDFDRDVEAPILGDPGTLARQNYLQLMSNKLKSTDKSIIYITQARANFDGGLFGPKFKSEGGYATSHTAGYRILLSGDAHVKESDLGLVDSGEIIGKSGYLYPEKSRWGNTFVKIPFVLFYGKGISNFHCILGYMKWRRYLSGNARKMDISLPDSPDITTVRSIQERNEFIRAHFSLYVEDFYSNCEDYLRHLASNKAQIVF